MATKNENYQTIWHRYDNEHEHKPCGTREAVERAVAEGLLELPEIDPYDVLAEQMAHALREEFQTDAKGRRYRVNHAVRVSRGGVQIRFGRAWDSRHTTTWRRPSLNVANRSLAIWCNSRSMWTFTTT